MKKAISGLLPLCFLSFTLNTSAATIDSKSPSESAPPSSELIRIDLNQATYRQCLYQGFINAKDETTLKTLKDECASFLQPNTLLDARRQHERLTETNPFVITPHRINYAIASWYSTPINQQPFENESNKPLHFQNGEVQFQLSFKFPLLQNISIADETLDLYAAYTNRSFWQFFDDKDSIPFRETNHEPEVWTEIHTDLNFFHYNLHKVLLGVNHQSNGQSGSLSRGWNRFFIQGLLQYKNSYLSLKTWQRFNEADAFDNSFDYTKYLGDFEIEVASRWYQHSFALQLRNQFHWNQYGSIQADYTYPITKRIKGYIQWFHGYGDSLIDMEHQHNKMSLGIVLADRI